MDLLRVVVSEAWRAIGPTVGGGYPSIRRYHRFGFDGALASGEWMERSERRERRHQVQNHAEPSALDISVAAVVPDTV